MQKNIKIMIISGILLIVFSLAIGSYLLQKKKNNLDNKTISKELATSTESQVVSQKIDEKTVRITFFNQSSIIGSLAIPESWEGHYRKLENNPNRAVFQFIDNQTVAANIFYISYYKLPADGNFVIENGEKELARKGGFIFTYKKASVNPYNGKEGESFAKMVDRVDELVKEFKTIQF